MHKMFAFLVLLLVASMVIVACAPPAAPPPAAAPKPEAKQFRVAAVLPGSINDAGWNSAAYAGLKKVEEELGAEIAYSENTQKPDFEQAFRDYANEGYDLIIGHGFEFGDPVKVVAPEFPDTAFVVVNGIVEGPNYASLDFRNEEAGYLPGVLAGLMTKSNVVGAVGGWEIGSIIRILEGYKLGVLSVNPDAKVMLTYTGTWEDVAKAKEAALAQIAAGADVILQSADAAGVGVIEACKEKQVWCIGFTIDQHDLAPDVIITSGLESVPDLIMLAANQVKDGTFKGGHLSFGMTEGVIDIAPLTNVPDDIAQQVMDVRQQILDGKLTVPTVDINK